jgi:hypothetical protein
MRNLFGILVVLSQLGLLLTALGVFTVGVQGLAALVLVGNVWLFSLMISFAVHLAQR